MLNILFIGDLVGKISRRACAQLVPKLRKELNIDLVIANGENVAHGTGITGKTYQELKSSGIDIITLGDHAFDRNETSTLLEQEKKSLIRPANYPPKLPGNGYTVVEAGTKKILVINAIGRVFMKMDYDCPFRAIDHILELHKNTGLSAVIVDFHAEATSEKKAMGWYFDGKVSAVLGTHTHVPTCDHDILPNGTAYVTDVGMVGAKDSVIGVKKEPVIATFLTQVKELFEPVEEGACLFHSVLLEIDQKTARAKNIQRIDKIVEI